MDALCATHTYRNMYKKLRTTTRTPWILIDRPWYLWINWNNIKYVFLFNLLSSYLLIYVADLKFLYAVVHQIFIGTWIYLSIISLKSTSSQCSVF